MNQNIQLEGNYSFDDYFNVLIGPEQRIFKFESQDTKPQKELLNEQLIAPNNYVGTKVATLKNNKRSHDLSKDGAFEEKDDEEYDDEEEEEEIPNKKNKKNTKNPKKKKDTPKRKRVNYCFEIHRSGCTLNKDSKLYCKVFLKGKLQSEVDLIKGARGKWAYTFYDQRKKKKERRYWPSQSSGPVIEDPCNCERCIGSNHVATVFKSNVSITNNNNININNEEEADFSSPSTEEITLVEYDQNNMLNNMMVNNVNMYSYGNEYQNPIFNENLSLQYKLKNFPNQIEYQEFNEYNYKAPTESVSKNFYNLKSSNDFQDNRAYFLKTSNDYPESNQSNLKSSNDYLNNPSNQRWGDFLSGNEYNQDFVETSFL